MSSDLFTEQKNEPKTTFLAPLAARLRPRVFEEFYGHKKLLEHNPSFRSWLSSDRIPSMLFWGPPGCGKTTLAKLLSTKTKKKFVSLSAIHSGVKDIKQVSEEAKMRKSLHGEDTLVFIDEIHRFSKLQQDSLLPVVEEGVFTLLGATTENPSFHLNAALCSRLKIIKLEPLDDEALVQIFDHGLKDFEEQFSVQIKPDSELRSQFVQFCEGDARKLLSYLEVFLEGMISNRNSEDIIQVTLDDFKNWKSDETVVLPVRYDHDGEEHYNLISAYIKSMRASDPDAAVYYLARMLEGGEDPNFIARRLVIFASEDVGLADPFALQISTSVLQSVMNIGMPEARILLSHGTVYCAKAQKSRSSYDAIGAAISEVKNTGALETPMHLRNAPTKMMREQGYGKKEKDQVGNLPKKTKEKTFYHPSAQDKFFSKKSE